MADEFDNEDDISQIDDDEIISSDIEEDEEESKEDKPNNKSDVVDDENVNDEDNEEDYMIHKKKMHHIKITESSKDNTVIVVKPEHRITSDQMSIYEYTHVVGVRATHISNGAPIYVDVSNLDDPKDIAKKEIDECKCPLTIKRRLGNTNKVELWSVNELLKPNI